MSNDFGKLSMKEQLALKQQRDKGTAGKKASETMRGHKDVMGTLGIYLPKVTIKQLKDLAYAEDTSVSKIIEELIAPRLLEGPRTPDQDDVEDPIMRGLD